MCKRWCRVGPRERCADGFCFDPLPNCSEIGTLQVELNDAVCEALQREVSSTATPSEAEIIDFFEVDFLD